VTGCFEHGLEERICGLTDRLEGLPWWSWYRRWKLERRVECLLDLLIVTVQAGFKESA